MTNKYIPTDIETDKIIASEQQILGCILVRPAIFPEVAVELKPENFTVDYNKAIYAAMLSLFNDNLPVYYESVFEIVQKHNSSPPVTRIYLVELMDGATDWSVIRWHTEKIQKFSKAKEMRYLAGEARELLEDPDNTASAAMIMQSAVDIVMDEKKKEIQTAADRMPSIIEELDKINKGILEPGLRSHIEDLNQIVRFKPGQLTVIAGRPGEGKTALLLNIAEYVAYNQDQRVLFFSLEMTTDEILTRQLFGHARIESQRLLSNMTISDSSWTGIVKSADYMTIYGKGLMVCELPRMTPIQIRSLAKQEHQKNKLSMVCIDYLTLVTPDRLRASSTREQEVASIIRSFKLLAKELMVPVLVCSQLSREVDKGEKKREPRLSDLRESGAIEQDADIVLMIHHPENEERTAKIKIAKNRHGITTKIDVAWVPEYVRFEGLAKEV